MALDVIVVETLTTQGPVIVEPTVPPVVSVEFVQTVIDVEVVFSGSGGGGGTDSSVDTKIAAAVAALAVL